MPPPDTCTLTFLSASFVASSASFTMRVNASRLKYSWYSLLFTIMPVPFSKMRTRAMAVFRRPMPSVYDSVAVFIFFCVTILFIYANGKIFHHKSSQFIFRQHIAHRVFYDAFRIFFKL